MEKLNYFTGKFSKSELEDHFDSLNEEKLKSELENFINQYLKLSEEEQLKCVELVLYIFSDFEEKIDKIIQKKILESINKILSNNSQVYSWSVCFRYLDSLYYYLFEPKEYEEYSILFENESYFFKIIDLVLKDNLENSKMIYSDLLSVFVPLFRQKSLPEERRNYFKSELEPFINFIFENIDFENIDFENIDFNYTRYWYFRLDELVSIFQFEHLKIINKYFIDNPQAEDIDDYLDFVSRHFDVVINDSIDVVRKIAEENNSDIIRDQAIKLIEKYDNAYSNEKSYSESISSLDAKQLLKQADNVNS